MKQMVKIFINGSWRYITDEAQRFVNSMKMLRSNGLINTHISIVRDIINKEIKIYSDAGRALRPLLIV